MQAIRPFAPTFCVDDETMRRYTPSEILCLCLSTIGMPAGAIANNLVYMNARDPQGNPWTKGRVSTLLCSSESAQVGVTYDGDFSIPIPPRSRPNKARHAPDAIC